MKKVAIGFILTLDIVRRARLIENSDYLLHFFVVGGLVDKRLLVSQVKMMIVEFYCDIIVL